MSSKKNIGKIDTYGCETSLLRLGWNVHFQSQLDNDDDKASTPARVVGVRKNNFLVSNGNIEWLTTAAGRIEYRCDGVYPVVGDWVLVRDKVIFAVLERENALSRGAAGNRGKIDAHPTKAQVLAANLDTVFVVCGLDRDFNLRRIERYLTLVYNCGLNPVIILTKADLHQDPAPFVIEVESVAFGIAVHLVAALDGKGLTPLEEYLSSGQTTTLIGSSGAGKSTIVNRLCGRSIQATASISASVGKGRHTTTSRDLVMLPQGGMVIDNPGLREIAFWDGDGGITNAFPEIEILSKACRFADCSHSHEPGCRVTQAVSDGEISRQRLESFQKMQRELTYLSQRQNKSADRVEKEQWKAVAVKIKAMKKK